MMYPSTAMILPSPAMHQMIEVQRADLRKKGLEIDRLSDLYATARAQADILQAQRYARNQHACT